MSVQTEQLSRAGRRMRSGPATGAWSSTSRRRWARGSRRSHRARSQDRDRRGRGPVRSPWTGRSPKSRQRSPPMSSSADAADGVPRTSTQMDHHRDPSLLLNGDSRRRMTHAIQPNAERTRARGASATSALHRGTLTSIRNRSPPRAGRSPGPQPSCLNGATDLEQRHVATQQPMLESAGSDRRRGSRPGSGTAPRVAAGGLSSQPPLRAQRPGPTAVHEDMCAGADAERPVAAEPAPGPIVRRRRPHRSR